MTRSARQVVGRLSGSLERIVYAGVLGLSPDPDTHPEPADLHSLPLPAGIDRSTDDIPAWALEPEFQNRWPWRRTLIGAHAYRLEETGEYDCGWRLADLAARFLRSRLAQQDWHLVATIPPPPVFTKTPVLEWTAARLARILNAHFRPDLFEPMAPIHQHTDRLRRHPMPLVDLYPIGQPKSVFQKRVLLTDWRWEKGRTMLTLAKSLRHAGAEVCCLTWLG